MRCTELARQARGRITESVSWGGREDAEMNR